MNNRVGVHTADPAAGHTEEYDSTTGDLIIVVTDDPGVFPDETIVPGTTAPDIEAATFEVAVWHETTPDLTVESAVLCEFRHGVGAALSRAYELELLHPHAVVRARVRK